MQRELQCFLNARMKSLEPRVSRGAAVRRGKRYKRQFGGVDAGANAARSAKSRQIAGKAVGDVHGRGGQPLFGEPRSQRQARFGIQVFLQAQVTAVRHPALPAKQTESAFRLSQASADVKQITSSSAIATQGAALRHFSHDCYIDQNFVSTGRVATGQRAFELP